MFFTDASIEIVFNLYYCTLSYITGNREFCVLQYWCTVIYSRRNCVYSCTGVLLYTAQGIVCTAVLVYCYIQHRYCVYNCTGLLLYTAQGIVCTAVLLYCYIQQRELCVQLYWCTVIYGVGNCVYSSTVVLLCTSQVILCTAVQVYCYIKHR